MTFPRLSALAGSVLVITGSIALAQAVVIAPEAQTEFQTYVTQQKVTSSDVDVAVGAALPETVELQPVPDVVITRSPELKRYRYVVIRNRIALVDPDSRKVVMFLK